MYFILLKLAASLSSPLGKVGIVGQSSQRDRGENRSQKPEVRSQKSEVRSQNPEVLGLEGIH
jgi:hypothetical protein